ncbi:MAG: hypothetical protein Q8O04_03155 [Deltaproteobacteria bacterium]|nr:hypothetical protein [Deltaproteobacteria bacterium]
MDVLGFSNMVRNSVAQNTMQDVFEKFHGTFSDIARRLGGGKPDPQIGYAIDWVARVFSDNVVFGVPCQLLVGGLYLEMFDTVLSLISEAQLSLALHGYFVRGAISEGQLFIDAEMVYGPALLEAYDLERIVARHPRVILSNEIQQYVSDQKYARSKDSLFPLGSPYLLQDSDGNTYLNYLEHILIGAGSDYVQWGNVDTHRVLIEERLTIHYNEPEYEKYLWLAQYHNAFCDDHADSEDYTPSYRIDEAMMIG